MFDAEPVVNTIVAFDPPKYIVMYPDGVAGPLHDTIEAAQNEADTMRRVNAELSKFFEGVL